MTHTRHRRNGDLPQAGCFSATWDKALQKKGGCSDRRGQATPPKLSPESNTDNWKRLSSESRMVCFQAPKTSEINSNTSGSVIIVQSSPHIFTPHCL